MPSQNQVIYFQKLLASGEAPEAKALAHAVETQKGGLGSWGPKTKAAFAAACEAAGISPETVDFTNPKDPELRKLITSLGGTATEHVPTRHEVTPPKSLMSLLNRDLGQIGDLTRGEEFADRLIAAAKRHHVALKDIQELKHADLDGDGKITKEEIGALMEVAHEKRTGREYELYRSPRGENGRVVENPNYDSQIRPEDLIAMLDPHVIERAKEAHVSRKSLQVSLQEWLEKPQVPSDSLVHRSMVFSSELTGTLRDNSPRMQQMGGEVGEADRGDYNLSAEPVLRENSNAKLDMLLKDYDFQATNSFSFKNTTENERDTVSNVRSAVSSSKANGIA